MNKVSSERYSYKDFRIVFVKYSKGGCAAFIRNNNWKKVEYISFINFEDSSDLALEDLKNKARSFLKKPDLRNSDRKEFFLKLTEKEQLIRSNELENLRREMDPHYAEISYRQELAYLDNPFQKAYKVQSNPAWSSWSEGKDPMELLMYDEEN